MTSATFKNGKVKILKGTMQYLRDRRNDKLFESDWTQMPDCPLSESKKQEWAEYRQLLRDLPGAYTNDDSIEDIIFPDKPD
tara:strand:- start:799 stop:1041 length:243 start_codon:yes stop_codon:yes gene_type:complete